MASKKKIARPLTSFDDLNAAGIGVGYRPMQFAEPVDSEQPPPVPERSMARAAGDLGLSLGQGAVGAVKSLTDLAGADNAASETLGSMSKFLGDQKSEQSKATLQASQARVKEAEESGSTWEEAKAYVGMLMDQPGEFLAQGVGSFATLGLGKIAQAVKLAGAAKAAGMSKAAFLASEAGKQAVQEAAKFGFKANVGIGAAQGVGAVKGSQYEQTYNNAIAQGMSEEQASALAIDAQRYGGSVGGTMQQVLGGILGGVAASTGPIERLVMGQGAKQAATGTMAAMGKGFMVEGGFEGSQGAQERFAGNTAAIDAGVLDPSKQFQGVAGQGIMEGTIGGILGAAAGPFEGQAPINLPARTPEQEAADAIRATKVPESGPMTRAANAHVEQVAQSITNTPISDMLGRNTDPLAGKITAEREAADDSAVMRNQFADRNGAALAGGGLDGTRADPLANMLADSRTSDANAFTNVQQAANMRPPMSASDAARILEEAKSRGIDMTAAPHPDGGFVVVPRAWVTPDMSARAEAEIAQTLGRMAEVEAEPVQRAERRRSDAADLSLNTDPVAGYIEDMRGANTPAAKFYVSEFDAGRITRADVEQRMQADRGKTPDERLAEAAAEGLKFNKNGDPFKTLMAANLEAKKTPGTVIEVAGGYAIRPQESTVANTQAQGETYPAAVEAGTGTGTGTGTGEAAALGGDQPGAVEALSNEQDAPQATTGAATTGAPVTTEARTEAAPDQAPEAARGDGAAGAGVPAAGNAGAVEADGVGGFDSAAWDKARAEVIQKSRDAGNVHLDKVPAYVETMLGKKVHYVHDPKVTGVIRTVDNRGNVYIDWSDDYSAEKEMASPVQDGKKTVMRSSIGPSDLKDYAISAPATKPKAGVPATRDAGQLVPDGVKTAVQWNGKEMPVDEARSGLETFRAMVADTEKTIGEMERSKKKGDPESVRAMREKLDARRDLVRRMEQAIADATTAASAAPVSGGVQADGVKNSVDSIAATINATIADNAIKNNRKLYAEKISKGYMTQEEADRRSESDAKMWSEQKPNDRTLRIAKAIADKDPTVLVGAWAKEGQGTYGNEGSMEAFRKLTGINLKRLKSADRAKAIFDWAGWSEDQVRADVEKRKAEKAAADAASEAKRSAEEAARTEGVAEKTPLRIQGQDGETTVKAYIDGLIKQGYTDIGQSKKGAVKQTLLFNPKTNSGYPMSKGVLADYAKLASERFNKVEKAAEPVQKTAESEQVKKLPFAKKEDLDHLFGTDQKRKKALDRIAKGTAYFGTKEKARDFIAGNGLKDTHEPVEVKPGRHEVRAKAASGMQTADAPAKETALQRRARLIAEREQAAKADDGARDETMDDPEMAAYENGLTAQTRADDREQAAADQRTVKVPPEVDAAITGQMQKQKNRVARLKREAEAPGMTMDEKASAQTKVKAAETTLRKMRTGVFDAEDAAIKAMESGDAGVFSEYADLFPDVADILKAKAPPAKGLGEQLAELNAELERQGPVQSARTREKRDQIRRMIAEQDFPEILKAVDGDIGTAEELNLAFQYAGDEPKAKTVERILKKRGITAEYAKKWTERLVPPAKPAPSANTIFTEDAAAAARARLKAKLGRLNSGIDPEMLMDGITLAGYHIEKGARTFSAYAKAMMDDLGDGVKPYLQSWYMAVRADPRAAGFKADMDKASAVEDLDVDAVLAAEDKKPVDLIDAMHKAITDGNMPQDNPALKKLVEAFDGKPAGPLRMKQAQEQLESAIVRVARDIVAKKEGQKTTFAILRRLYDSQPNLNIRTSTSISNQAYSTPAPLAFLASELAGITGKTSLYEPTAGNGMLTIGASPKNVTVNEIQQGRIESLKALGLGRVIQGDALEADVAPRSQDRVITNPPFGSIKDDNGAPTKIKVDGYNLGQIDHLIAARALETMKDDGRAVIR